MIFLFSLILVFIVSTLGQDQPLRVAVAGVVHNHIAEVVRRIERGDFVIVGVWEKDERYRHNNSLIPYVDSSLFFENINEMLDSVIPEAVITYTSTFDHLTVIGACVPRYIPVMVEKPLCANRDHLEQIKFLYEKFNDPLNNRAVLILTNYETSWYPV
jgi:predicted dehydrogenase